MPGKITGEENFPGELSGISLRRGKMIGGNDREIPGKCPGLSREFFSGNFCGGGENVWARLTEKHTHRQLLAGYTISSARRANKIII